MHQQFRQKYIKETGYEVAKNNQKAASYKKHKDVMSTISDNKSTLRATSDNHYDNVASLTVTVMVLLMMVTHPTCRAYSQLCQVNF